VVVALAPWSLVIAPGKAVSQDIIRDIQITNAALGATLEDEKARSTLKISYKPPPLSDSEDEEEDDGKNASNKTKTAEIALCSLTPGSIEQAPLNVLFTEDDTVTFEVIGKNSIHLFGNYIDQNPVDFPPDDYDEENESEDDYNLLEVSSDVAVDPMEYGDDISEDDEGRFEEIDDAESKGKASAGKKHARDSDVAGDVSMTSPADKNAKKLKNESGSAVPVGEAKAEPKSESKKAKKKKEKKDSQAKPDGTQPTPEKEKNGSTPSGAEKVQKSVMKELSGGLKTKDVKVGTGKQAKAGNMISMRYIGKLPDGKVFDQNTKGKPFSFRLGKGEVIKGWDQGIAGMQVGGERLLIIPPALAYGNKSMDGIPANSTLRFECKLLEIK